MKKYLLLFIFILAFSLSAAFVFAQEDSSSSAQGVLSEIMQSQNVQKISDINCQKVTETQFENLGDKVMDLMHPDQRQHQLMDQMMGGEGSKSLQAMHIMLGQRYLGCGGGFGGYGMMGGTGMMGTAWNNPSWPNNSLMNFGNLGPFGMILMILLGVLIIIGIVFLIKLLPGSVKNDTKNRSALDFLSERYAKGEIDKKEFEDKKHEIDKL